MSDMSVCNLKLGAKIITELPTLLLGPREIRVILLLFHHKSLPLKLLRQVFVRTRKAVRFRY